MTAQTATPITDPTTDLRPARHPRAKVAAVLMGCALLAACGSSATAATVTTPTPTGASSSGSAGSSGGIGSAAFQAYRTCLTQHGATLPSGTPTPGSTGGTGGFGGSTGAGSTGPNAAARTACASLRPAGGFGGTALSASAITAFRSCMSDHGVTIPTTKPTPSSTAAAAAGAAPSSGGRGIGSLLGGLKTTDPTVATALTVCRVLLPTRTGASTAAPSPAPTS